jgi:hypothetical protein
VGGGAGVVAAAALSTLGMDALLAVDGSLGLMSLALATGVVAANANNDTAVGRGLLALGDAVSNVLDNTIGNAKKTREGIERERMARIDQLKQEGSQVIASRKALQSAFEDEIASRMAQQSAVLKRASAVAMAAASPVDDELPLAEAASSAAPAAAAPAPAAPASAAPAAAAPAAAAPGAIEENLERVRVACRGFEGHWAALVESRRVVLELESQAAAAAAHCEAAASALSVLERQQAAESVAAQAAASEKADAARAAAEAAAAEKAAAEKAAATERAAKETVNKCARQEQLLAEAEAQATSTLSALRAAQAELAALLARAGDELLGGTAAPAPSLTVPTMSPVVQRAPEAAPEATPVPEAPVPPPLAAMASPPLASPPAMARQADILPSRMPVAPSTPALARAPAFTFMPGAPSSQLPPPPRSESPPTAANVPKPNVNRAVPRPEVVTASIAPKPNVNFGAAAPTRAPVTADTVPRPKSNAPPRSEADKAVSSASLNVAEVMSDTSLPKASANRDDSSQCVWAAVKLRDGVSDTKFPPARLLSEFPEALSVECIFDDRGRCRSQCLVFPAAMKSKQLQSSVLGCWVKPLKQPMEPNAREGYNWVSYTREQLIARSGHEVAW